MENEFVTYEQSVKLKKLGFNENCFGFYNNAESVPYIKQDLTDELKMIYTGDFEAPLKQQVFRWFRNYTTLYKINSFVQEYDINNWMYSIDDGIQSDISIIGFESYEEAENACIDKLISLIEAKI